MLHFFQDFPAFSILLIVSTILQALALHIGIDLYRNVLVKDSRVRLLASLLLAEMLILVCLWLQSPHRIAVEFPAAGSTLRYSLANEMPGQPSVVWVSAADTPSQQKLSFVITLRDASSGRPVLQTYLKGGQSSSILVPPGAFAVSVELGRRWFGAEKSFGQAGVMLPSPGTFTVAPGSEGELRIAEKPRQP